MLYLLIAAAGCKTENKAVTAWNNFTFDTAVMARLPLYDSLASAIVEKITLVHTYIHPDNAYFAFRYRTASSEPEVFTTLPAEMGTHINRHIGKLGPAYFYGFDVFKDSTIKIYIKSRSVQKVDITENLSYYPAGKTIQRREYPAKDTILNKHWQYWARFDNQGFF